MANRKQATPQEIKTLKASLKKLKPDRELHFLYFDHGPENIPVLVIDRIRIGGDRLKALLAGAKKKKPIKGMVAMNTDEDRVEFRPVKAPGKLQRSLKGFYRQLPQLKTARVIITQDKTSVQMQMDEAEEVALEKSQAVEDRQRRHTQLVERLAALEAREKESELERQEAEDTLNSSWNLLKRGSRKAQLALLQKKEEQRRWESESARAELDALTRTLTEAEIARQSAEEEAQDLKDMWSLIQQQEWEGRRKDDSAWRDEIEAHMELLALKGEAAARLEKIASGQEEALQIKQGEMSTVRTQLQAVEERQRQLLEQGEPIETALKDELKALKDRLRGLGEAAEGMAGPVKLARSEADRANRERDAALAERNRVFMTQDERERSDELRRELADAEDGAARMDAALAEAQQIESRAYHSLNAVNNTAAEIERLRVELAGAKFDIDDLSGKAGQWSFGRSSRKEVSAKAQAELPEAKARAEALQKKLEAATGRLSRLEDEASDAVEDARGATLSRLEIEAHAAESSRVLAHLKQEVAEEEATIAEWALDSRRKVLDRAISQDPTLRDALSARQLREQSAERLTGGVLTLSTELSELQQRNEALRREMSGFDQVLDPELTEEFAENLKKISALSEKLSGLKSKAELSCQLAEKAAANFDTALERRRTENSRLDEALVAVELAEEALRGSVDADHDAITAMDRATDQAAEVERQRAVYGLVIDGQSLVRGHTKVFEALRGKDLFSSSDVEAIHEAVGPAAEKIRAELEKHAYEMIQAGANAEELARVFERVPNGLRPDAYREEVGAVDALMRRFEEIDALKDQDARDDYLIKTARQTSKEEMLDQVKTLLTELDTRRQDVGQVGTLAALETGRMQSWLQLLNITDADSADQKQLGAILGALWKVNVGLSVFGAGVNAGKALTAENPDADPVLQKIQDQDKLEALNGLANAGIDIARQFVPILLTAKFGKMFIEDVVHCAARTYKANYDTKLKAIAKVHGSPLAGPLEESLHNELKLAEKYGFSAAVKAVAIAGDVLKLGPEVALGFAMSVSAWSAGKLHDTIHSVLDWKLAAKANALLERAKAGDVKAKSRLLKYHAKYAKGLLALKAQEGDPFAMQYVSSRGLSEDDIRRSSLDIITRYLLKAGQQSGDMQTFGQWMDAQVAQFSRLADLVVVPLKYGWSALFGSLKTSQTIGDIEVPLITVPLEDARKLVAVVADASALQERSLVRTEPTEAAQRDLEQTTKKLAEMISSQREEGTRIRERVGEQITRISKVEQRFQKQMTAPLELSSTDKLIMTGLQEHIPRIRMEHIELAGILTVLA